MTWFSPFGQTSISDVTQGADSRNIRRALNVFQTHATSSSWEYINKNSISTVVYIKKSPAFPQQSARVAERSCCRALVVQSGALVLQSAGGAVLRFESNMRISRDHAKNISLRLTVIWLEAHNIRHRLPGSTTMTLCSWVGLNQCEAVCVCVCMIKRRESKLLGPIWKDTNFTVFLVWTLLFSVSPILYCLHASLSLCHSLAFQTSISGGRASASVLLAQTRLSQPAAAQQLAVVKKTPLSSKPASFSNSTLWPALYSGPSFVCTLCMCFLWVYCSP